MIRFDFAPDAAAAATTADDIPIHANEFVMNLMRLKHNYNSIQFDWINVYAKCHLLTLLAAKLASLFFSLLYIKIVLTSCITRKNVN